MILILRRRAGVFVGQKPLLEYIYCRQNRVRAPNVQKPSALSVHVLIQGKQQHSGRVYDTMFHSTVCCMAHGEWRQYLYLQYYRSCAWIQVLTSDGSSMKYMYLYLYLLPGTSSMPHVEVKLHAHRTWDMMTHMDMMCNVQVPSGVNAYRYVKSCMYIIHTCARGKRAECGRIFCDWRKKGQRKYNMYSEYSSTFHPFFPMIE